MKCQKCKKSNAVRSVSFIISDGTKETNSQKEVEGFADTSFDARVESFEKFGGQRTGYEYSGSVNGKSSTSSYEIHHSTSVTQTKLASKLSNLFGPYLEQPQILLTREAALELEEKRARRSTKYKVVGVLLGLLVVIELMTIGIIFLSITLGGILALASLVVIWFSGLAAETAATDSSRNSHLNSERAAAVERFNDELADMYGWLERAFYCSRCNAVSDEEDVFDLIALESARPQEPTLPTSIEDEVAAIAMSSKLETSQVALDDDSEGRRTDQMAYEADHFSSTEGSSQKTMDNPSKSPSSGIFLFSAVMFVFLVIIAAISAIVQSALSY